MEPRYIFTCIDHSHGQVKMYEANKREIFIII